MLLARGHPAAAMGKLGPNGGLDPQESPCHHPLAAWAHSKGGKGRPGAQCLGTLPSSWAARPPSLVLTQMDRQTRAPRIVG